MIHRLHNWMNRCFLFRSGMDPAWSGKRKTGFVLWNMLWLLAAGTGLTLCTFLLSTGGYAHSIAIGFFERPMIFLLNFLPILLLLFLLFFLLGRAWLAFALSALVFLSGSIGHYYLLLFRDDPLMFADLLYLKEAGKMAESYALTADWEVLLSVFAALAGGTALALICRWRPGKKFRIGGCALFVAAAVALTPSLLDTGLYNSTAHYTRLSNIWSPTQQYISRGFVYPFLHSISEAFPTPPAGYNAKEAQAVLDSYEDAPIPEGEKVNVIGIMLEAFNDFTKFDQLEFASDVYAPWHELAAESYSGELTTNIFAGGTIDTERTFLTGYSTLENYRTYTNSFVWYFKEQGYRTMGDHPCYGWFYNRQNVNRYIGFDEYRFVENFYTDFTGGGVAMDDIFFPELQKSILTGLEQDAPLFSFSINYQGHGPYDSHTTYWGEPGTYVVNQGYTTEQHYILENYFGSVSDTLTRLTAFVDELRQQEEPVVLVLFGDHNPWMGDGNSVYQALGINFDMSSSEGFYNYYNTPYLIWANDAAKEALDCDFVGEGPNIGPYFLMPLLFDLCDWEGPAYLQAIRPVAEQVPILSVTGRYAENGALTGSLSPEGKALVDRYRALQYHKSRNFSYRSLVD